jgi:ubiquinone/menaquinone biosynthesis C-methylase UbiE
MNLKHLPWLSLDGMTPARDHVRVFDASGDDVIEGAIVTTKRWYRIENGILDALPDALAAHDIRRSFAIRHSLPLPEAAQSSARADEKAKVEQQEFFKTDSVVYDRDVSNRSFYVASDRICFGDWALSLQPGSSVCDLGAGSGRVSIPLATRGHEVLSTDISEEMMVLGRRRAIDAGLATQITSVLADAEDLPLNGGTFQSAVCYGALHHVPNPAAVVAEASRILVAGGRWLSYDPHRSKVRFLFDWAMRVVKLYDELASDNLMLSGSDLERWCRDAAITPSVRLHFFLPPHLLAPLPPPAVEWFLRRSDAMFNAIGLGSFAGVIAVAGRKSPGGPA